MVINLKPSKKYKVAMICLWDRLPDEIQTKILHLKRKAEIKDKDLFWYNFGERIKNIMCANRTFLGNTVCKLYDQRFHHILINVFRELSSDLEEIMFKSYPYMSHKEQCDWTVNGKDPIEIFYGNIDQTRYLSPAELVEELIAIQIHYDTFVRGTVDTGTMVYNGKTRKWVNNHYQKKIDANFAKINKLIFGTKII